MDGLESVTNIGQRTSDNNAHGVVEVGALHFLLQVDLANTFDVADVSGIDCLFVAHFGPSFRFLLTRPHMHCGLVAGL